MGDRLGTRRTGNINFGGTLNRVNQPRPCGLCTPVELEANKREFFDSRGEDLICRVDSKVNRVGTRVVVPHQDSLVRSE